MFEALTRPHPPLWRELPNHAAAIVPASRAGAVEIAIRIQSYILEDIDVPLNHVSSSGHVIDFTRIQWLTSVIKAAGAQVEVAGGGERQGAGKIVAVTIWPMKGIDELGVLPPASRWRKLVDDGQENAANTPLGISVKIAGLVLNQAAGIIGVVNVLELVKDALVPGAPRSS